MRLILAWAALAIAGCDGAQPPSSVKASSSPPALSATAPPPKPADDGARAELSFAREGKPLRSLQRADLEAAVGVETLTALDPYYNRKKTYRALPLVKVLEKGFALPAAELARLDFVLRARDGYTVPLPGTKLVEKGGYLAIADVDVPGWEPIGPQRANPGPYYVVWSEAGQQSLDTYPRPWQLATIEIASFEATFPHTVPPGQREGSPAMVGFRIFRSQCVLCHAINREGGRVGPDLNVPKSIIEYRPEAQIKAYIKNPLDFRYGTMPAHPGLSDEDLDGLIAYFKVMKDNKHDPSAKAASGH